MTCASGDCHIIISADLQDPISLMPQMIKHWLNGYKLVIAHRKERNEPNVQKLFSYFFHLMMRKIVGNAPKGGFDYVLFDNSIKEVLLNLKEKDNSIFYMMTWLGYEYVSIPYTREARSIGESRWTLKKKVGLVIDSVLLFSPFPLRLIIFLGVVLGLVAILSSLCMLFNYLNGNPPDSWIIAVLVGLIIGAAQLISIGVIGEYLWHTLETVRNRPSSVIEKIY
jgi:dolichol-phosphate mannosyltransferase